MPRGTDDDSGLTPIELAKIQGVIEGTRAERERKLHTIQPVRHRRATIVAPKTRRRWGPPIISAAAGAALAIAVVALWGPNRGAQPVDVHPYVNQVVYGYGSAPILPPQAAPDQTASSSPQKTTKSPAATSEDVTTGQGGALTSESKSTHVTSGSKSPSRAGGTTGSKASGGNGGGQAQQGGGGKGDGGSNSAKPPAGTDTGDGGGNGGGGGTQTPPPASDPEPTPGPTQDSGVVTTLVDGLGTTVGDLTDTVGGTVNGLLGSGG